MSIPQIGDLIIFVVTVAAQLAIGRLYFSQWRKLLPTRVTPFVTGLLYVLWTATAFHLVLNVGQFHAGRWLPSPVRGPIEAVGFTFGAGSAASLVIFLLVRALSRRYSPAFSAERRYLIRSAGAAAVAAPFAVAAFGGIIERTRFEVKEIDLPVPNLHPDLEGLRIAQISDLHVSPFLSVREAARVVDMTNELRPQLVFVTGDLISDFGDPLEETVLEIARLRADAGVLGCLGNHEVYARCQNYETALCARRGIKILRGESRELHFGKGLLNVAGVDYQRKKHSKPLYLAGMESLVIPGAANLLLSHNPDVFPTAVRKGYDVMLAGHTHGGQVTVEIVNQGMNFARFFTPYVAGLYRIDGRSGYVNAGIGTIGMPVRIGAPPEISLFRLRKA
jgi:predicted MPP superfamily phosphohydrolase